MNLVNSTGLFSEEFIFSAKRALVALFVVLFDQIMIFAYLPISILLATISFDEELIKQIGIAFTSIGGACWMMYGFYSWMKGKKEKATAEIYLKKAQAELEKVSLECKKEQKEIELADYIVVLRSKEQEIDMMNAQKEELQAQKSSLEKEIELLKNIRNQLE